MVFLSVSSPFWGSHTCPIWGSLAAAPFFSFHSVPCKCTHTHVSSFLITFIQVKSEPNSIFHMKDGLLLFLRNHLYVFFTRMKSLNTAVSFLNVYEIGGKTSKVDNFNSLSVHFGVCIYIVVYLVVTFYSWSSHPEVMAI